MPKMHLSPLLFFVFLLTSVLGGSAAAWEDDKEKHMIAGTAIYGICVALGYLTDEELINYKTCLIPVGVAAVGKEWYDSRNDGAADWKDVGATLVVPAAIAGVTYTVYEW